MPAAVVSSEVWNFRAKNYWSAKKKETITLFLDYLCSLIIYHLSVIFKLVNSVGAQKGLWCVIVVQLNDNDYWLFIHYKMILSNSADGVYEGISDKLSHGIKIWLFSIVSLWQMTLLEIFHPIIHKLLYFVRLFSKKQLWLTS